MRILQRKCASVLERHAHTDAPCTSVKRHVPLNCKFKSNIHLDLYKIRRSAAGARKHTLAHARKHLSPSHPPLKSLPLQVIKRMQRPIKACHVSPDTSVALHYWEQPQFWDHYIKLPATAPSLLCSSAPSQGPLQGSLSFYGGTEWVFSPSSMQRKERCECFYESRTVQTGLGLFAYCVHVTRPNMCVATCCCVASVRELLISRGAEAHTLSSGRHLLTS